HAHADLAGRQAGQLEPPLGVVQLLPLVAGSALADLAARAQAQRGLARLPAHRDPLHRAARATLFGLRVAAAFARGRLDAEARDRLAVVAHDPAAHRGPALQSEPQLGARPHAELDAGDVA